MNKTADQLFKELKDATEYLSKIGKAQPHFDAGSVGELRSVEVITQIHHQAYSGATNYWGDKAFDAALGKAAREQFTALAGRALDIMKQAAQDALIAEKTLLEERLEKIREIEKSRAGLEGGQ